VEGGMTLFALRKRETVKPNKGSAAPSAGHQWDSIDPLAYATAHRRAVWLLRLSVSTNVVLGAVAITLAGTLSVLMPLKEVRPAFITLAGAEDQIVRIEPLEKTTPGFELLLESIARRYVKSILEIDGATQGDRMREIFSMTAKPFAEDFNRNRIESGAIQKAIDSGLQREIIIRSGSKVGLWKGTYTYVVDFIQVDRRHGEEVERKPLRAYLAMTTAPQTVKAADVYSNPLGVVITEMTLKESPTDPE
jgi:type IV secretion system protein VirB8